MDNDIDICALAETWLRKDTHDDRLIAELTPDGYTFNHVPRNGHGGGVGILTRSTLPIKILPSLAHKSYESIHMTITCTSITLNVLCVYRPPPSKKNGLTFKMFLDEFSELLDTLAVSSGKLLIVGDINVHWDNETDANRTALFDLLSSHELIQHIKEATHLKGHILDVVVTRSSDTLLHSSSVGELFSDHHIQDCRLQTAKPSYPRKNITYRKIKDIDLSQFKTDIVNHLESVCHDSLSDLVNGYDSLQTVLDSHAPLKSKTVSIRPRVPWINDELLALKRKRRQLERRWRSTGLSVHKTLFIEFKACVKQKFDKAKQLYYKSEISNCEKNQAKLYKVCETLLSSKQEKILPDCDSESELAENFNQYFVSKITTIRENLERNSNHYDNTTLTFQPPVSKLTNFNTIDETKLLKMISASSNASCALDPVPTTLIKSTYSDVLLTFMCNLINKSLLDGVFPSSMKSAQVIPLIKKASLDRNIYKNYRPVSNLSFVSKLIEKTVAAQLTDHLKKNEFFEQFQSAYKSGHSTDTALLRVMNDVLLAADNGLIVILLLLDLSAAFDTIDHAILLALLKEHFGVDGTVLDWLSSYLTDRSQSVQINMTSSTPSSLRNGVPQGSILGPLLFCVYMTPLGKIIRKYNMCLHIYADDTQLYC